VKQFVKEFFVKVFQPFSCRMQVVVKLAENERLEVFTGVSLSV